MLNSDMHIPRAPQQSAAAPPYLVLSNRSTQGLLEQRSLRNTQLFGAARLQRRFKGSTCAAAVQAAEEYKTFTNKSGNVINRITDNVWGAERPFLWNKIDVNGRMAILRLGDGSLWVHSPVGLDENLKRALAELGDVKHVVSPNFEHVSFAKQWQEAYPSARLYACPGLPKKKSDVRFDRELDESERAPREWRGEVECTCLTYERNPFTGKPFFNEVVFVHKPSKLLIVSDLFWNYPGQGTQLGTQAWKFGMDRVYAPFYRSFMIREKDDFEVAKNRIFNEWDWDGIVPCHGDVLFSGGKQILRQQLGLQNGQ